MIPNMPAELCIDQEESNVAYEKYSYGDGQSEMGLHSVSALTTLGKTLNLSEPQFPKK